MPADPFTQFVGDVGALVVVGGIQFLHSAATTLLWLWDLCTVSRSNVVVATLLVELLILASYPLLYMCVSYARLLVRMGDFAMNILRWIAYLLLPVFVMTLAFGALDQQTVQYIHEFVLSIKQ